MEKNSAEALADLTVLDTAGRTVRLGDLWRKQPVAIFFVRHFGCMFCREQVGQLRELAPQFAAKGVQLAVVGNGSVADAAEFASELGLTFPLYTDPRLGTYRAAGLKRSLGSIFNFGVVKNAWRARRGGHRQGRVRGDAWQQGGAFLIAPGNEIVFEQRSETGGDHADPRDLLAAAPAV